MGVDNDPSLDHANPQFPLQKARQGVVGQVVSYKPRSEF